MKSIDLALYEAIKDLGENVSDETAKKIVGAVHAIYENEAEDIVKNKDFLDLKLLIS